MANTTKKFRPTVSYTNKNGVKTSVEAPKYRLVKRKIKSYIGESADGVVNVTRYRRGQDGVFTETWSLNAENPKRRAVVTSGQFVSQPQANAQTTQTPTAQTPTAQTSTPTSTVVIPQTVSATTNSPAASLFNSNSSIPQNI
jgi:hypothetical protein